MKQSIKFILILLFFFGNSAVGDVDPNEKPFTFVQLCDPQLGVGGYEHDVNTFKQAVNRINILKPDFVIICGDLAHYYTEESINDFKDINDGFKVPCYIAPGNHDIGDQPTIESLIRYRRDIGEDYFSFEHKGYTFIVTNSLLWKSPLEDESQKHDSWFKQELQDANDANSPVFVVQHIPLYKESPDEPEDPYYTLPVVKRKELLDLFEKYNVVAVLGGHLHETIINDYNGIQLVNSETTSLNFDGRPLGFRVWQVISPTLIRHEFVPLEPDISKIDFDNNYSVDIEDFNEFSFYWLQNEPSVDIFPEPFGDGIVNFRDMITLAEYWLKDLHLSFYWKLDETEGNIATDSVGHSNGLLIGEPLWQPLNGKINGALQFDGINNYIKTDFILNPGANPFRVFLWIKGCLPGQVIISQLSWNGEGRHWLSIYSQNGALMTELASLDHEGDYLISESVITDNQWHHIGFIWDGQYRSLYVDEAEVAKDSTPISGLHNASGGLHIGAGNTLEPSSYFLGMIDDIRIYDEAVIP